MTAANISTFSGYLDWDGSTTTPAKVRLYFGLCYITEFPCSLRDAQELCGPEMSGAMDEFIAERFGELFAMLAERRPTDL